MSCASTVNLLHQLAKNEGFSDFEIKTKTGSNHGDNYVGIITAITISGTKSLNGHTKHEELELICKTPPIDKIRKKKLKSDVVFAREICIYTKLLPAYIDFQRQQGLTKADSFLSFPKLYASEVNQNDGIYILIMENMKSKNFKMWPKERIISLDHQLCIMTELGKFHGISFAMEDQRPNEFNEFKQLKDIFVDVVFNGLFQSFAMKSFERAANAMKCPKYKQYMQHLLENYADKIKKYFSMPFKKFGVVGHGDCWSNNILFQYRNDDVRLTD